MNFIKKCPLFFLLLTTGILFSLIGIGGMGNVYAGQEYDPLKAPVLSVMFTAMKDGIYPWQIFSGEHTQTMVMGDSSQGMPENDMASLPEEEKEDSGQDNVSASIQIDEAAKGESGHNSKKDGIFSRALGDAMSGVEEGAKKAEEEVDKLERLAPLRESTHEEYINHISADIYGDAGIIRAAEYEFGNVDESYFDDAMFIGDSRTVGLRDYTDLSKHADFFCETSLTIYQALEEDFDGVGTIRDAIAQKNYGKIYIMVGINELGRGTTENFMEEYTKTIDTLRELAPEAKIFIQGIMRVAKEKDSKDAIFNNSNINARNNAIATLADNRNIFYIDVNEAVCDEEGNLNSEYTFDQIHLLGAYNSLWKEFLLSHGVDDKDKTEK